MASEGQVHAVEVAGDQEGLAPDVHQDKVFFLLGHLRGLPPPDHVLDFL